MSGTHALVLLSVVLAVGVLVVVVVALLEVRRRLARISNGLDDLESALAGVESHHLRGLDAAVAAINDQLGVLVGLLPGTARKAAVVARRRPR
jgi:hypothetical protein